VVPFRILTVCTANICRSPVAAALLTIDLSDSLHQGLIEVSSAGTHARESAPACDVMGARVSEALLSQGSQLPDTYLHHAAKPLMKEQLAAADLVLALDRDHSGAIARLLPAARPKTFTLRQAAALMSPLTKALAQGQLPQGAPALPPRAEPTARLDWVVAELDAGRGLSVIQPEASDGAEERDEPQSNPYDVLDPHVVGPSYHASAASRIISATNRIAEGLTAAMRA